MIFIDCYISVCWFITQVLQKLEEFLSRAFSFIETGIKVVNNGFSCVQLFYCHCLRMTMRDIVVTVFCPALWTAHLISIKEPTTFTFVLQKY